MFPESLGTQNSALSTQNSFSSLAERAYVELKRQIISGELAAGTAILEGALAARFGFSKTPVREALKRLELEGLTRVLPRTGYVVTPVSLGDVQALFELRLMLEPPAAELAAERIHHARSVDGQRALLLELDELSKVSFAGADHSNYAELLEINTRFHLGIVRAAGNPRLAEVMARLLAEMERVLHLALDLRDASDLIIRDHVEIVRALYERDGRRARQVSERHLLDSRQRVIQAIVAGSGLSLLVKE